MHRIVHIENQVRVAAFGACFLGIGVHLWEKNSGATPYVLLALQFLAYPQLVYLRARRSKDPKAAELSNQYLDSFLLGAWTAGLGFPAWIAYALCFSTTLNAAVNRGLTGVACSLLLFSGGILAWIVPFGFQYWTATTPLVTALCFFGSLGYSAAVGCVVHRQNREHQEGRVGHGPTVPEVPPAGF